MNNYFYIFFCLYLYGAFPILCSDKLIWSLHGHIVNKFLFFYIAFVATSIHFHFLLLLLFLHHFLVNDFFSDFSSFFYVYVMYACLPACVFVSLSISHFFLLNHHPATVSFFAWYLDVVLCVALLTLYVPLISAKLLFRYLVRSLWHRRHRPQHQHRHPHHFAVDAPWTSASLCTKTIGRMPTKRNSNSQRAMKCSAVKNYLWIRRVLMQHHRILLELLPHRSPFWVHWHHLTRQLHRPTKKWPIYPSIWSPVKQRK